MMEPLSMDLGAALVEEIRRIEHVFGVRLVLWVGVVLLVSALLRRMLAVGARLVWLVRLDRRRRAGRVVNLVRALVWVVGALLAVGPIYEALPVLTVLAVVGTVLVIAVAMPGLLRSLVAGLSVAVRGHYREGDQIEVRGHRGSIRALGLVRVQLWLEDGSTVWLPSAVLDGDAVKVERASDAVPVRVSFRLPRDRRDEVLERVRCAVMLSPFRRAGSRPRLLTSSDEGGEWAVELQTWATGDLDLVRRSLRKTVDDAVTGLPAGLEAS